MIQNVFGTSRIFSAFYGNLGFALPIYVKLFCWKIYIIEIIPENIHFLRIYIYIFKKKILLNMII